MKLEPCRQSDGMSDRPPNAVVGGLPTYVTESSLYTVTRFHAKHGCGTGGDRIPLFGG